MIGAVFPRCAVIGVTFPRCAVIGALPHLREGPARGSSAGSEGSKDGGGSVTGASLRRAGATTLPSP